jgi:hypothetical protein
MMGDDFGIKHTDEPKTEQSKDNRFDAGDNIKPGNY